MKKIALSIITISLMASAAYADGTMDSMDKYNLAYPTLSNDGSSSSSNSSTSSSWFDGWFDGENEPSGFYIGGGFGSLTINNDASGEELSTNSIMAQAGYLFNQYISVEGRYYYGIGGASYDQGTYIPTFTKYEGDITAWGAYIKPSLPLGPVKIYGLVGYGSVTIDDIIEQSTGSAFQWGGGLSYSYSSSMSFFVDYLSLYDDTDFDERYIGSGVSSDVITFGITYKF